MSKLTQKQETFCLEYLKDGNATRAYKMSYNAGNMKDKQVWEEASKLLRNPKVSQRIGLLSSNAQKKIDVTADKIIQELARIAFFDTSVLYNEDGTLKQISELSSDVTRAIHSTKQRLEKQGQDKEDWAEIKEIRTHDKLKALELLGKTLAMFTDKNITDLKSDGPLFQINLKRD